VLRPRLEREGHRYRTNSDSESALHAYESRGLEAVRDLRGMFAFAIWDRRARRLVLARDRLGIKPLYYWHDDRELVFASEIKAILAVLRRRPQLDREVLPEYLATRFVAGERTFFRGVRQLRPGHLLTWTPEEGISIRAYWRPAGASPPPPRSLDEAAEEVRVRLADAVESHLMSDVPLGLFLSGGIDSSAIAALMARAVRQPIRSFAIGFAEPGADELAWARLAARSVGAEHHEMRLSAWEFFRSLPRLIWHEDEPIAFPASVPLFHVSHLAAEHVKVVLTGEGADELFLGYNRYRVAAWNGRLDGWVGAAVPPAVRAGFGRAAGWLPGRAGRAAARSFLARPRGVRAQFYDAFAVFSEAAQLDLLADPQLLTRSEPYAESMRCLEQAQGDPLGAMSRADLQTYLVRLLMKQDRMSMAASIESRVPFLDAPLVDCVLALPGHYKLHGLTTKAVLRRAVSDLVPPPILTRRKMGFPVPLGRWLGGPFRPLVNRLLLSSRALDRGLFDERVVRRLALEQAQGVADHSERLWLLLNLELWQRIFLEDETLDDMLARAA
jgi:asparagine synthase (glutamine-hydrolysing)